jgi:hypothetical protein
VRPSARARAIVASTISASTIDGWTIPGRASCGGDVKVP